jgi:hypothetical protein
MDAAESTTHTPVLRTVFTDPADGRFKNRIAQFAEILKSTNLPLSDKEEIEELLVVIALKFASLWAHNHRYAVHENALIEQARKNPMDRRKKGPQSYVTAQELYIEFDGFLVQVKSILDHMVNVLHYTHGLGFGVLSTFGKKGKHIVDVLRKKVVDQPNAGASQKETALRLIRFIESHIDWLTIMIDIRDRMNHYKHSGLSTRNFAVMLVIDPDGTERLLRPRVAENKTTKQLMTELLDFILDFVEYFLGVALATNLEDRGLHWVDTDDPVKARWEMLDEAAMEAQMACDTAHVVSHTT